MTISELVLTLQRVAERSQLGPETPVFCMAPHTDDLMVVSSVEVDDEGDCVISLV